MSGAKAKVMLAAAPPVVTAVGGMAIGLLKQALTGDLLTRRRLALRNIGGSGQEMMSLSSVMLGQGTFIHQESCRQ